jgi:zinc transport system ATP-binding protein
VIEIRDGAVVLGGRPILRGVDLAISAGEAVAVLGANGSGKSTLVRLMLGLAPSARGDVLIYGTPLAKFRDWRRIGFVPQRASAVSGIPATVWEVVASGRLSRRRLFASLRSPDRSAIRTALETVGLAGRERDSVSTLSGGQQQRVLIARALAAEPGLLVLDEPTAGVDAQSQQAFADALGALIARGTTIVLVAHGLGPLRPLIKRTVVMRDGRIAYDGPATRIPAEAQGRKAHGHHHPALQETGPDFAPLVASPVDAPLPKEGSS